MKRGELEFMNNWKEFQKERKWLYAPVAIVEDPQISANAKILFMVINSYCKKYGICHAKNETLCGKIALKETMLKKYLKELKESQMITVKLQPAHKWPRQIFINFDGLIKRYPLPTLANGDIQPNPIKAFLYSTPLEDHPDYKTLKNIYKCRPAGDKYLYYSSQGRK
jgi:hypothetical protein